MSVPTKALKEHTAEACLWYNCTILKGWCNIAQATLKYSDSVQLFDKVNSGEIGLRVK